MKSPDVPAAIGQLLVTRLSQTVQKKYESAMEVVTGTPQSCALPMGRRPKDDGPIFSEVTIRGHPVLVTTPDHATYHTKCQMPVHFFRASPSVFKTLIHGKFELLRCTLHT